jgi:hypothetical protein
LANISDRSKVVKEMLAESRPTADVYEGGEHLRNLSVTAAGVIRDSGGVTYTSGTDRIDRLGIGYLPQFPLEDRDTYIARVRSSWLLNGVRKAIEDMTGKLFDRPVEAKFEDDEGGDFAAMLDNANLQGDDLNTVAMELFQAAMKRGLSFALVDAPQRPGGDVTVGQVRALGLRPYVTVLTLEEVLGWDWKVINNVPTITHFRFQEEVSAPGREPWSDDCIRQIRSYDLTEGGVVVSVYQAGGKNGAYDLVDQIETGAEEITVAPFYTDKTGFMRARTPLYDLTEINLAWFRSNSDQANIMHHARVPMKFFAGFSAEDIQAFAESPGYAISSQSTDATVNVVEHSGSATATGREELKDLEFQMQVMGLQLVVSKTGNNTATGDAIDERKQNSRLAIWADNLKSTLERVVSFMADYAGQEDVPQIVVNTEFGGLGHLTMDQVRDLYDRKVLSGATYIAEAKRRGVLDEAVDAADEKEMVQEEVVPFDLPPIPTSQPDRGADGDVVAFAESVRGAVSNG